MTMRRLQIEHQTTYEYAETVTLLPHKLLLRPREGHDIRIESAELTLSPAHHLRWQRDIYDNSVAWASFIEPSNRLSMVSRLLIQRYDDWPLDFLVADFAVFYPFQYEAAERVDLGPYLLPVFVSDQPLLGTWLRPFWQPGQVVETYVLLDTINKAIARDFAYQPREQPGVQTPATTLDKHSGSCRDSATLVHRSLPQPGPGGAFCQRLSVLDPRRAGPGRHPCVGGSLSARRRLEGIRPHLRSGGRQRPHRRGRESASRMGASRIRLVSRHHPPVAPDAGRGSGRGNSSVATANTEIPLFNGIVP